MFKVELFSYSLPFSRPFNDLMVKEGFLLRLTDEEGVVGYGDISPMIGRSKETLQDVLNDLQRVVEKETEDSSLPSLSFGLETAYLSLMAASRSCRLNEVIIPNGCRRLPVNGLLYGNYAQCLALIEEGKQQGIRTFKLKVGHDSVEADRELVRRLSDVLPDNGRLRLDANGAWDLSDALIFCRGVHMCPIDYLEDPTSNYLEWNEIVEETTIRLALDEGIQSEDFKLSDLNAVDTLIIKPTLIGGIAHCLDFASSVVQYGKNVVFTSSFESDFGCFVIANMASTISPTLSHGVWTPSLFSKGILKTPLEVEDGFLSLESDWSIDTSRMKKIDL